MEIQHNDGLLSYVLPGNLVKCVDKLLLHMCDSYIRVITIFTSIPSYCHTKESMLLRLNESKHQTRDTFEVFHFSYT